MALPVKKSTKTRKRRRMAYFKQSAARLNVCPKCKKPIRPHRACTFCGFYRGRETMAIKLKSDKAKKKEDNK